MVERADDHPVDHANTLSSIPDALASIAIGLEATQVIYEVEDIHAMIPEGIFS